MQQIDLPCGNAEHQPCIFHIDHHNPFTRAQRSTGANFQTVNASAFRGKSQPFYQPAAARIRAIMAMSAPLTCSSGAAETGAEDCTVAWLFITNGSGDAFAQTE